MSELEQLKLESRAEKAESLHKLYFNIATDLKKKVIIYRLLAGFLFAVIFIENFLLSLHWK